MTDYTHTPTSFGNKMAVAPSGINQSMFKIGKKRKNRQNILAKGVCPFFTGKTTAF